MLNIVSYTNTTLSDQIKISRNINESKKLVTSDIKINKKFKKSTDRYNKNENIIINFIDFIRKDLLEKDKQRNLFNYWLNKFNEISEENKEEQNENKKNFEKTFGDIANIPKELYQELNIDENTPKPDEDHLYDFIKSAKYEIKSVSNKKNEKSEALEKKKNAGENLKNLDKKLKNFLEVLREIIYFVGCDKKIIIEENIDNLCLKIWEDVSLIELKFSDDKGNQKKRKKIQKIITIIINMMIKIMIVIVIMKIIIPIKKNYL